MKHLARTLLIGACAMIMTNNVFANDFAEVGKVIQKYFDGTEKGQLQLLHEAFLPTAEIQYVLDDGSLGRLPFPDYVSRFQQGRQIERYGRLVSTDVTGNAAVAKVEIFMASRDRVYTDYILLLKLSDGWRISNKVATFRDKF